MQFDIQSITLFRLTCSHLVPARSCPYFLSVRPTRRVYKNNILVVDVPPRLPGTSGRARWVMCCTAPVYNVNIIIIMSVYVYNTYNYLEYSVRVRVCARANGNKDRTRRARTKINSNIRPRTSIITRAAAVVRITTRVSRHRRRRRQGI